MLRRPALFIALTLIGATFLAFNAIAADPSADFLRELDKKCEEYNKACKSVIGQAVAQKIDFDKAKKSVDTMVEIGVWFCKEYQKKYPISKKMMQIIIDNRMTMQKLKLAQIEELWHDAKIFKKKGNELEFDVDDEDYEDFGNPKDSIVHPATVTILMRAIKAGDGDAKKHMLQIKAELAEVLDHVKHIRASLKSKK